MKSALHVDSLAPEGQPRGARGPLRSPAAQTNVEHTEEKMDNK